MSDAGIAYSDTPEGFATVPPSASRQPRPLSAPSDPNYVIESCHLVVRRIDAMLHNDDGSKAIGVLDEEVEYKVRGLRLCR